jgi:hypothetical protein
LVLEQNHMTPQAPQSLLVPGLYRPLLVLVLQRSLLAQQRSLSLLVWHM